SVTTPYVVPAYWLKAEEQSAFRPRYEGPLQRMPVGQAWQCLERVFPGIDRKYLRLLLAARGYAEGDTGRPPFILAAGPSGSGKTTTVQVAASVCGDVCSPVTWSTDTERLRQGLMAGIEKGGFVSMNEVLKEGRRHRTRASVIL